MPSEAPYRDTRGDLLNALNNIRHATDALLRANDTAPADTSAPSNIRIAISELSDTATLLYFALRSVVSTMEDHFGPDAADIEQCYGCAAFGHDRWHPGHS